MDQELRDQLFGYAKRVVYALLYFPFDKDPRLRPSDRFETERLIAVAVETAKTLAFRRFADGRRTWEPQSLFAFHMAWLMAQITIPGKIYEGGAPGEEAIDVVTRFLRFEGWELRPERTAEFVREVNMVPTADESIEVDVVDRYAHLLRPGWAWVYTGEVNENVFGDIDDFADRNPDIYSFVPASI